MLTVSLYTTYCNQRMLLICVNIVAHANLLSHAPQLDALLSSFAAFHCTTLFGCLTPSDFAIK